MAIGANHDFGAGPIIGGEANDCVFEHPHGLQLINNATNFDVHAINHGGMNSHFGRLKALLFFAQRFPWKGAIDFFGAKFVQFLGEMVGRSNIELHCGKRCVHKFHTFLPGIAFSTQLIPSFQVATPVFFDVFGVETISCTKEDLPSLFHDHLREPLEQYAEHVFVPFSAE